MNTDRNAPAQVAPSGSTGLYGTTPNAPAPAPAAAQPAQAAPSAYLPSSLTLADIYKDPTVLAFLRSSGLSEQTAANDVARRQAAIGQALNTNLNDLGAQGQIARRNIAGNFESRGVLASGQALQAQAENEAQQARQQTAMQQNAMNQINDLSGQLAQQVANNQQRASELGVQSYINNSLAAGKAAINDQYNNHDYGSGYDDGSSSNSGSGY